MTSAAPAGRRTGAAFAIIMPLTLEILLLCIIGTKGSLYIKSASEPPARPPNETSSVQPEFVTSAEARTVTSRVSQPAHLHCRVANLGDRAVSWIRERDLHILTTGLFTFTRDKRFVALHADDTWTLKLLGPRVNDSGTYLCQVSTEPRISQRFSLTVTESRAYIANSRELFVRAGSSISLSCTLTHNISQLYWLHNGTVIHYTGWPQEDQPMGLGRIVATTSGRTSSVLVTRAGLTDSGQYTCQPVDAEADNVTVHVLTGEHPAAMQRGAAGRDPSGRLVLLTACLLVTRLAAR